MSAETVPGWLVDFQARFGAMLRTPLDPSTGTFRARPSIYDRTLCKEALPGPSLRPAERLAVYNRQYWFRFFGLLQSAFPLTARLLGYFHFNGCAARFLLHEPPAHWDIDRAPDGFEKFLARMPEKASGGRSVDRAALIEAAEIDAAWRRVFLAPASEPYRPTPSDGQRLLGGRLRPSETTAVLEEHWPLVELRRKLADDAAEPPVPLPPRLERPQFWAFVRRPGGIGQLGLEPLEARLFTLLGQHPVAEALALLEAACPEQERAELPANAQRWLARSVELDFWSGLRD